MDTSDLLILHTLSKNPATSLEELAQAIRVNSPTTVYNRLVKLQQMGLVEPPPSKKMARSRKLTKEGQELLRTNPI